jgi:Spy/CpxP family protein refolding chaperone
MNKIIRSLLVSSAAAAALAGVAPAAFSDSQQEQAGQYNYGPGMMGGYGMGPGMMGGYGMGPGMMGGYGMGPGMMGGYGRGAAGLGLTPDQVSKIGKIRGDMFKAIEPLAQQMFQEHSKMQAAYFAGNADPEKLKQAYAKMSELQKQMFDAHINAQKQMDSVLTKEQRQQQRAWGPGMMGY